MAKKELTVLSCTIPVYWICAETFDVKQVVRTKAANIETTEFVVVLFLSVIEMSSLDFVVSFVVETI